MSPFIIPEPSPIPIIPDMWALTALTARLRTAMESTATRTTITATYEKNSLHRVLTRHLFARSRRSALGV